MSLQNQLNELVENNIISPETSRNIQNYFQTKRHTSPNKLLVVFSVFGALLLGLGIILILAHNWDNFNRLTKTILAFIPLIIGQLAVGFTLWKKPNQDAWKEGSSTFLVFAVGAVIALISQIYNIPGNFDSFMLTWVLLVLPLIFITGSSMVSLLYIIGITVYALNTGYWNYPQTENYYYWLLLVAVFPHYYKLITTKPNGNFTLFHHWFIVISLTLVLGTLAYQNQKLMFVAYMSLFGFYYLIGRTPYFQNQKIFRNPFLIIGSLGSVIILLITSYDDFWNELFRDHNRLHFSIQSPEYVAIIILIAIALYLLWQRFSSNTFELLETLQYNFLDFLIIFIIGLYYPAVATILINLLVFVSGIMYIVLGNKNEHLGILNFGLLMIAALVVCRFFDSHLSFVLRGMLFIAIGIGFFVTNYQLVKKKKQHEN